MASRRNAMKDVVVETKRPRKSLPSLSADQVREAIGPIIDQLPSHKAAPPELKTIDDYVLVINVEWREAQDRFLKIGELLDRAENRSQKVITLLYVTVCHLVNQPARSSLVPSVAFSRAVYLPIWCRLVILPYTKFPSLPMTRSSRPAKAG